uniref:Uncharacterized protein n=1 Tax=Glossina austeni TaxID=7395 RepID=A0A1A9VB60_GLOAU
MKSTPECSGPLDQMDEPEWLTLIITPGAVAAFNYIRWNLYKLGDSTELVKRAMVHPTNERPTIQAPGRKCRVFSQKIVNAHMFGSFTKGAAFIKSARPDTHSLTDGVLVFAGTVGPRGDIEYNIQFCKTKDNCYQNRIRCYSLYHVLQFTLDEHKYGWEVQEN